MKDELKPDTEVIKHRRGYEIYFNLSLKGRNNKLLIETLDNSSRGVDSDEIMNCITEAIEKGSKMMTDEFPMSTQVTSIKKISDFIYL